MRGTRYRFRTVWELPGARPAAVYSVLVEAEDYPSWWPQVREARRTGADTGAARFRSRLPFDLRVVVRETCRDPRTGVIEATMSGDLCGGTRWTVLSDGHGGSRAVHEQDVEVAKPLLRLLSVPARPLLLANHALMMRAGRRGLLRRLRSGLDEQ